MFMKLITYGELTNLPDSSTSTETTLKYTFPMLSVILFHSLNFGLSPRNYTIHTPLRSFFSPIIKKPNNKNSLTFYFCSRPFPLVIQFFSTKPKRPLNQANSSYFTIRLACFFACFSGYRFEYYWTKKPLW